MDAIKSAVFCFISVRVFYFWQPWFYGQGYVGTFDVTNSLMVGSKQPPIGRHIGKNNTLNS